MEIKLTVSIEPRALAALENLAAAIAQSTSLGDAKDSTPAPRVKGGKKGTAPVTPSAPAPEAPSAPAAPTAPTVAAPTASTTGSAPATPAAPATSETATSASAPAAQTAKPITLDTVRDATRQLITKKGRDAAEAILKQFGSASVSALPAEKFADFHAAIQAALA